MNEQSDQQAQWVCAQCNLPLVSSQVNVAYLGSAYPVELLRCPQCGLTLVTEELATGKMAEVEKTLEDK
jgi:hypothetical protein